MLSYRQKKWIILYLLIAMPISGASVDIYVPSLPTITQHFAVSKTYSQLTISVFLLGYSVFSLLFGPMSDAIGRKKPLVWGGIIYTLSAFFITLSPTITVMLDLRFLQGIGVAAIAGVSRTITPDVFEGINYQHVTNMTTIAWSIGPIMAPFIGGYFEHYLNWKWCFYALTAYGLVMLTLMLIVLPETNTKKTPFSFGVLSQRAGILFMSPIFIGSTLICGLVYGCIITFNTMGPFLIQMLLGYSAVFYGYMALIMGVAFFIGNYTNKRLIAFPLRPRLDMALLVMVVAAIIECLMLFIFPLNVYNIVIPTFIIIVACGVFFPNGYGTALRLHPEFSGTISAIMSACFIFTSAVISAIASGIKVHNQLGFSVIFIVAVFLLGALYIGLFRPKVQ